MIKSIILITMAFACAMADVSAQYAGTTQGAATWNPPSLGASSGCTTSSSNNYATVSFNVTFPTAGVREIAAMAEDDFKSSLAIYVYLGGFPGADTCANIAHTVDLSKQFSNDGGPVIDDFIYFTAATYTFVVTGSTTGGIFAVHVNPSDAVGQLSGAGPFWNQPETDSSESGGCQEDTGSYYVPFETYSFTVATNGFYDLVAMYVNASSGVGSYAYITLYQGIPTAQQLSVGPCNTSATYLDSTYSYADGVYVPYANLTAGVNYTIVVSLGHSYYGYWAVQVIPTRVRFFEPTGFVQPVRDSPDWTEPCDASSLNAPWGRTYFQAEERVYVIDTASPPSPFQYVDTYSFLYEGANTATPPSTCSPHLILGGDTGDITPVFAFTAIGQNYTVVVSTYSSTTISNGGAYALYFFTGNPIGSIPSVTIGGTTIGGTTGDTTGDSVTTGVVTNNGITTGAVVTTGNGVTVTTGVIIVGGTTTHSAATIGNGAASVTLSVAAVFAVVLSALL